MREDKLTEKLQIMKEHREDFDLKERLVDKSVEAYILALETINRLTIQYRLETFCYLICNAWELLLKAKILGDKGKEDAIYYKEQEGKTRRSLSLDDCLNKTMQNQKDHPIRRNIERIEELRNESVHLVISQIPREVMSLFQAGVINYHKRLHEWFGVSLSDRVPVGMMSIVYEEGPERWDMTNQRLRQQLGKDSAKFLGRYCADLNQDYEELQRSPEFSIGIEYRLVLTKNPNNADIALSSGATGGESTQVVESLKDPGTTHPFRQKELIEQLMTELKINQFDIQCVNKVYKIKAQSKYFYQGKVKGSPAQYSRAFLDWLIERYKEDDQFFEKTRQKAKKKKERK